MTKTKHLIVSEEEHGVMDRIQANLKELDEIQLNINRLNIELPKSLHPIRQKQLSQIEAADKQIKDVFQNLQATLKETQQKYLNKLNQIRSNVNEENKNDADSKEDDLLSDCTKKINAQKQFLIGKLDSCNEKIQNMGNAERKQRKQQILSIGKEVNDKYGETKKSLSDNCKKVEKMIDTNNNGTSIIEFKVDEKIEQGIFNKIKDIGGITETRASPAIKPEAGPSSMTGMSFVSSLSLFCIL